MVHVTNQLRQLLSNSRFANTPLGKAVARKVSPVIKTTTSGSSSSGTRGSSAANHNTTAVNNVPATDFTKLTGKTAADYVNTNQPVPPPPPSTSGSGYQTGYQDNLNYTPPSQPSGSGITVQPVDNTRTIPAPVYVQEQQNIISTSRQNIGTERTGLRDVLISQIRDYGTYRTILKEQYQMVKGAPEGTVFSDEQGKQYTKAQVLSGLNIANRELHFNIMGNISRVGRHAVYLTHADKQLDVQEKRLQEFREIPDLSYRTVSIKDNVVSLSDVDYTRYMKDFYKQYPNTPEGNFIKNVRAGSIAVTQAFNTDFWYQQLKYGKGIDVIAQQEYNMMKSKEPVFNKWVSLQVPAYQNVILPLALSQAVPFGLGYIKGLGSPVLTTASKVILGTYGVSELGKGAIKAAEEGNLERYLFNTGSIAALMALGGAGVYKQGVQAGESSFLHNISFKKPVVPIKNIFGYKPSVTTQTKLLSNKYFIGVNKTAGVGISEFGDSELSVMRLQSKPYFIKGDVSPRVPTESIITPKTPTKQLSMYGATVYSKPTVMKTSLLETPYRFKVNYGKQLVLDTNQYTNITWVDGKIRITPISSSNVVKTKMFLKDVKASQSLMPVFEVPRRVYHGFNLLEKVTPVNVKNSFNLSSFIFSLGISTNLKSETKASLNTYSTSGLKTIRFSIPELKINTLQKRASSQGFKSVPSQGLKSVSLLELKSASSLGLKSAPLQRYRITSSLKKYDFPYTPIKIIPFIDEGMELYKEKTAFDIFSLYGKRKRYRERLTFNPFKIGKLSDNYGFIG